MSLAHWLRRTDPKLGLLLRALFAFLHYPALAIVLLYFLEEYYRPPSLISLKHQAERY
ncbi:hypothetical protein BDZ45DRAFT_370708 [Acephala macrosclerotiorum]|nr:hypothetical protein BDZ45DRAFT_370708 [Acephala macrosclerotiorum]